MNPESLRPLLKALYPVGALILVSSLADPLMQTWPFRFGELRWRFGAVGLGTASALGVIFALVWMMGVAALLGHRRALRALSVAHLVLAAGMIAVLALFVLDFVQVRAMVDPRMRASLDATVLKSMLLLAVSIPAALGLGIAGWTATRATGLSRSGKASQESSILFHPQPQGQKA